MILSPSDRRSINMSALNLAKGRQVKPFTAKKLLTIQKLYPDYVAIQEALPHRSFASLKSAARIYEVAYKKHVWTTADVAKLKQVYAAGTTPKPELLAAFPGFTIAQIRAKRKFLKLKTTKPRYAPTGYPLLGALRAQMGKLNMSGIDIDDLAQTKQYFEQQRWRNGQPPDWGKIVKAILCLEGTLTVSFPED